MKSIIIIAATIFVSLMIILVFSSSGIIKTDNGVIFCKRDFDRVFHDQTTVITEDELAFYGTKDGKDNSLRAIAEKECR